MFSLIHWVGRLTGEVLFMSFVNCMLHVHPISFPLSQKRDDRKRTNLKKWEALKYIHGKLAPFLILHFFQLFDGFDKVVIRRF